MDAFGVWLRAVRNEKQLDIRKFGKLCGVDASTISRLENNRTKVTLHTAIRICAGLNISIQTFVQEIWGKTIAIRPGATQAGNAQHVLSLLDIEHFSDVLRVRPYDALKILAEIINSIYFVVEANVSHSEFPRYGSQNIIGPEDLNFLLVHHPLFKISQRYPPLSAEQLRQTYRLNGVINLMDAGAYIRGLRRENNSTLQKFKSTSKRSASVISKLESGSIEQVKLEDIMSLDSQLGQGGQILSMFWEAVTLNIFLAKLEINAELVNLLIICNRWLQFTNNQNEYQESFDDFHVRVFDNFRVRVNDLINLIASDNPKNQTYTGSNLQKLK